MAERRMISKAISVSEKVNSLSLFSRLLYTWMIPHADDFGRLPGSPAKVRALVVPMGDETTKDVQAAITEIAERGLIQWYGVDGEKYIQINNFDEHQVGLHKRTKSKIPEPKQELPGNSGKVLNFPLEENRTEQNRNEGKGTEQNDVSVPTFDNPHVNRIQACLKKYHVECKGIYELEKISSYIGVLDIEVIEHCIKESEHKHVPYAISVIERFKRDGKTRKESLDTRRNQDAKSRGSTSRSDNELDALSL